jgi:hypothetical protein
MADVTYVDDQQYAIGFYIGDEAETEHGVLDDIATRVLHARTFHSGVAESTRSVAAIKLGVIHPGNVQATVNDVTGEEECYLRNFFLSSATRWTVRKIFYQDETPVPNDNPDYKLSVVVLEESARKVLNKIRQNQIETSSISFDEWHDLPEETNLRIVDEAQGSLVTESPSRSENDEGSLSPLPSEPAQTEQEGQQEQPLTDQLQEGGGKLKNHSYNPELEETKQVKKPKKPKLSAIPDARALLKR